jgi:membrane protein involved in colicin uptake
MAQRNPLNERYQGDGPGGQTRKSAARAKPVTQAASSVHIRKKPQTDAEKRAARKAREKEEERKAAERARRRAERAKAEAAAAQDDAEKPAAKAGGKAAGGVEVKAAAKAEAKPAAKAEAKADAPPKGFLGKLLAPPPNMPATAEYRKWRRLYWILLLIGIFFIVISFAVQSLGLSNQTLVMVTLGCAYAPIIGAFVVDIRKVKPLIKAHQRQGSGNKSPKQLKHEQEARQRAEAMEAARKAARDTKKKQRRKKPDDAVVPGDEQ